MELFLDYFTSTFFQETSLYIEENFEKTSFTTNIVTQYIYKAKEWLYTFSENFYVYTYDLNIYLYPSLSFIFSRDHSKMLLNSGSTNILSVMFDSIYYLYIFSLPTLSSFFYNIVNDSNFINIINYHPEYILIYKHFYIYFHMYYYGNMYNSIYILNVNESFITPPGVILQFIAIYFIITIFVSTYFNYFSNSNNEDTIIDHDYLLFNVTLEAEEEIGSVDDMLLSLVIIIYIFFWFFWVYSWASCSITPHFSLSIILFPLLYFIIIFIPLSLLYDFGSNFITYLNGVSKSSSLIIELMFDLIAISIFFLRLLVQNVRLIFMLFTYTELHEMIVFWLTNKNTFLLNDIFYAAWEKLKTVVNESSYGLILSSPLSILHWLYELFHTFFMLIFQFIAFFAMVFWLFLFLYSMFVSENQENYFNFKRKLIKIKQKKLVFFKNLIKELQTI